MLSSAELATEVSRSEVPTTLITGRWAVATTDDGRLLGYDLTTGRLSWQETTLAPDRHHGPQELDRAFLTRAEDSAVYGILGDRDDRFGVFRVEAGTGTLTMITPPITLPLDKTEPAVLISTGDRLYGVTNTDRCGAFALR